MRRLVPKESHEQLFLNCLVATVRLCPWRPWSDVLGLLAWMVRKEQDRCQELHPPDYQI